MQRDKAGQDWNSWIVLSVVFWAEQEGMEMLVTELGCIFCAVRKWAASKISDGMRWSWRVEPSMNECKQLFNLVGGKKIPLHVSLSGAAFWALWFLLACPSADTKNNGLLLIRGFSCCQTPRFLCLLYFSLELLVWDVIEVCWPSPRANALMLGSTEGSLALIKVVASQALAVPSPALCSLPGLWHCQVSLGCRTRVVVNTDLKKSFQQCWLSVPWPPQTCTGDRLGSQLKNKFSTSEYTYWIPNVGCCFIVAWVLGQMLSGNVSSFIGWCVCCQNSLLLEKLGLELFFFFNLFFNSNTSFPQM